MKRVLFPKRCAHQTDDQTDVNIHETRPFRVTATFGTDSTSVQQQDVFVDSIKTV